MSIDSTSTQTVIAASVAPEDLERGNFVAILNEVFEFPSFMWCDCVPAERDQLVRLRCLPMHAGVPLRIKSLCLPFVFVKSPFGHYQTVDVRKVQLVRLKDTYAKTVWKALRRRQV
jgi:hypothetical protein